MVCYDKSVFEKGSAKVLLCGWMGILVVLYRITSKVEYEAVKFF